MASLHLDQAEGLRRLMTSSQPKIISIISALGNSTASLNESHLMLDYLAASYFKDGANAHILYGVDNDPDVLKHYGLLHKPSLIEVAQGKRLLTHAISSTRNHFTSSWLGTDEFNPFIASQLTEYLYSLADAHEVVMVETRVNQQHSLPLPLLNDSAIVIQMNEKATSVKQAYSLIKQLHHKIGKREFGILVHGNTAKNASHIFTKIASVARRFLGIALEYMGYIPSGVQSKPAYKTSRNVINALPNAGTANIYHEVAQRLLGQTPDFTTFDPNPMF